MNSGSLGIGLLGLGNVGSGVAQELIKNKELLSERAGINLELRKVLVRDIHKSRFVDVDSDLLTTNWTDVIDDPNVNLIVELIGGETPAKKYVQLALSKAKHVVTANKELIAKHGQELLALAEDTKVNLLFEGSVGGSIPIISALTRDLSANRIDTIRAIINGTSNFILTAMAEQNMDGARALQLAQSLGYAEANPHNDVEGIDASYKLAILATLAFQSKIDPSQVYTEGISTLEAKDFQYARELGYAIKLLAIAKCEMKEIQVRVHPALIPDNHMLAKVVGAFNAVELEGNLLERTLFHGLGAGQGPSTSAVLGDILEIGRRIATQSYPVKFIELEQSPKIIPMNELKTLYYFRLNISDRAGVLAQITKILGDLDISIASVIQKDSDPSTGTAEIVITTHISKEESVQRSLSLLEKLDTVTKVNNVIRIEEILA
ncbi:homoserine dehydrogenase [SAR202 cluster bacterium AC-409-J13_OGT_754m]|nr:homoserine dehydrogenase [SAR202 cluster bacterium AC-409-J13_OGT_754m]